MNNAHKGVRIFIKPPHPVPLSHARPQPQHINTRTDREYPYRRHPVRPVPAPPTHCRLRADTCPDIGHWTAPVPPRRLETGYCRAGVWRCGVALNAGEPENRNWRGPGGAVAWWDRVSRGSGGVENVADLCHKNLTALTFGDGYWNRAAVRRILVKSR